MRVLTSHRRVRDSLHGSVDLSHLENRVLDTEAMQRLRAIKQTAFLHHIFPGATHTRLEHSLGALKLASTAWRRMAENQQRLAASVAGIDGYAELERSSEASRHGLLAPTFSRCTELFADPYPEQVLRLAALMHDLGHPPFSHSGERFLPSFAGVIAANPWAPEFLQQFLRRRAQNLGAATPVRHEVYTLLLTVHTLVQLGLPLHVSDDPAAVAIQDVCAVMEPDIDLAPASRLARLGVRPLCHQLVSGELDIDRMDYLLRDSARCGVVYGVFDVDRILDSLAVYQHPETGQLHLAMVYSGLAAFDDYLRSRRSMYMQLYGHKTSGACEAMLQQIGAGAVGWSLPPAVSAYAAVDDHTFASCLLAGVSGSAKRRLKTVLDGLLRHRQLWRRVYEDIFCDPLERATTSEEAVMRQLKDESIRFQRIETCHTLTQFLGQESQLRLIKKNSRRVPLLLPLASSSWLRHDSGHEIYTVRIYVSAEDSERALRLLLR